MQILHTYVLIFSKILNSSFKTCNLLLNNVFLVIIESKMHWSFEDLFNRIDINLKAEIL